MTGRADTRAPNVVKIHVPFAIRKHGGRKVIVSPAGQPLPTSASRASPPLLKALARAFRWRKLLERGDYATIDEIARAERVNPSYVSRVIRLTLLAPDIVEAILDGRCAPKLKYLFKALPVQWCIQIAVLVPPTGKSWDSATPMSPRDAYSSAGRSNTFGGSRPQVQPRGEAARLG